MKIIVILSFLLISTASFGQTIKFQISGIEDTTLNLVRYFGKGLYYADTADMKGGIIEFDGSKQKAGILALFLPGQNLLEFVYNHEDVSIEARAVNPMASVVAKKSEENKIFFGYTAFLRTQRTKTTAWSNELKTLKPENPRHKELTDLVKGTSKKVVAYQQNIVDTKSDMLVAGIIKMSMDVVIPDAPVDADGSPLDSNFRYKYFREHYFDNIDLTDDRLVRTPIFHGKLANYFGETMMIQHWDTIIKYAFDFCDRLPAKSDMLQYCVSWITSNFEQSKIMGMDKVLVYMGNRYYRPKDENGESVAHWMPKDKLETLIKRVDETQGLVMGARPANLILRDTTDTNDSWTDYYSLKSDYTILYFWDPNCGHCKKVTPKLQTLYEKKFRDRNIEIFAIGKAVGKDFEDWKSFIKDNNLEFINVAVTDQVYTAAKDTTPGALGARQFIPKYTTLESLNYQQTFDVFQSPKVFILDKDKRIIAKSLSISQIEEMLDKAQGFQDLEKIFPKSEEPEDEQIH